MVGLYFVLAAGFRFALEFIRVNPQVALGLTMAQWMSACVVLAGLVVLTRSRAWVAGPVPATDTEKKVTKKSCDCTSNKSDT